MQAIILAAGMGRRLKQLTSDKTKCMISVNGKTLIERMLRQIDKYNLSKVFIVVGYQKEKLIDYVLNLDIKTPIEFITNDIYDKTNNIFSLSLAKDKLLEDDTLIFESDIIFEDSILESAINDNRESLILVDKYKSWMDGSCITLNPDGTIKSFIKKSDFDYDCSDEYYKTVNIYKFSKDFSTNKYVPYLDIYLKEFGKNIYYEEVFSAISNLKYPGIAVKNIDGKTWYEIDDEQDLNTANVLFSDSKTILDEFNNRYGGYWRFSNVLDFCYLVNPYYPPKTLISNIKSNFSNLVTSYPSGCNMISKVASISFNVCENQIVVGNGASELIKILVDKIDGLIGLITPSFEEYKNRIDKNRVVTLETEDLDFKYDENTIINYYSSHDVNSIVLINPDNPTGNYIDTAGIKKLLSWSNDNGIRLIIDESFIDFSDYDDDSLLNSKTLDYYPNLVVIKSISKSHGVPGLRLGILASSDIELINSIRCELPIWNINSLGEYYLQTMVKHSTDFKNAIVQFRDERKNLYKELVKINCIKVYPSQANYFFIEILNGVTSDELTCNLLYKHNIFIKDLSCKIEKNNRQFIRIAIKKQDENERMVKSLEKELL